MASDKHTPWSAEQVIRFVRRLREKIVHLVGEDAETIRDTVEGEVDLEPVAATLIKAYGETKARVKGLDDYIDELKAKRDALAERADRYRNLIFDGLSAAEQTQVRTLFGTASITAGRPRTVVHDETQLPAWFFKSEPDVTKIKDALSKGEAVPGAAIEIGAPSLTIRVK